MFQPHFPKGRKEKMVKQQLLQELHAHLDTQIETAQAAINSAKESKNNETKSTAGDKYETGRAMLQIEQEKNEMQLSKVHHSKSVLSQIDLEKQYDSADFGSLILTNQGKYFIAIGIGKVKLEDETYFVISPDSPVGKLLLGKQAGEQVEFRNKKILIKNII